MYWHCECFIGALDHSEINDRSFIIYWHCERVIGALHQSAINDRLFLIFGTVNVLKVLKKTQPSPTALLSFTGTVNVL